MYFSKAVSFIFIIFIARIIILNARYVKRNVARRASMNHEYIQGWLKLKGRMLVNAMKAAKQKKVESDCNSKINNSGGNGLLFGDLGSHPIATPRTLHAEDFTLPSPGMCTVTHTATPEPVSVTATTSRLQYHRPNFETITRGHNREEETVTTKHSLDMEEVTHNSHQHPKENGEEEMVTRKHDTDIEEDTQKCYKTKNYQTNQHEIPESERVTEKHSLDIEKVTHKSHQHANENGEVEKVTEKQSTDIEEDTQKCYKTKNYQANPHENSESERVTEKHSLDIEKVTHKSHQHANENREEEKVTAKQGTDCEDVTHESSKAKIQHGKESCEEEMVTDKYSIDIEEVTHESHEYENENREEETITRKKGTDIEDVTRETNKAKSQHGDENSEEEMITRKNNIDDKEVTCKSDQHTRKQNMDVEDVTQKCYAMKNQYTNQKHEEEVITRKHDTNIEEATLKNNQRVNENHEKEIITQKYGMNDEGVTHKGCRTKSQHANENREEEMITRKHGVGTEEATHKTAIEISTVSYKVHGCCKCVGEKPHGEYETNIEKPHSKSYQTSKPYNGQKETAESAHRNQSVTESTMGLKSTEKSTEKIAETTTEAIQEADEEDEECVEEDEEEAATAANAPEQTKTKGGTEKEKVEDKGSASQMSPFKFIILEPTFTKQMENKVEQINKSTTTCAPDEEEVDETPYQTPLNNSTEQTDNTTTNQTPVTDPSAPLVYQTMCFPVTERTNDTQAAVTEAYKNVTLAPSSNGTHENTTQAPQSAPSPITQPPVNGTPEVINRGYPTVLSFILPPKNTTQGNETATIEPANAIQEVTTPSFAVYAAMCFPVTKPPTLNSGIGKTALPLHVQKKRRLHTQRRQTVNDLFVMGRPSMRATLSRVVRELKDHENKPINAKKILTLMHYAGEPRYQRYYLRGLKGSANSNNNHNKYEIADYPEEETGPKLTRGSKNIDLADYEEGNEHEQSGIFEDTMRVKTPLCPTKAPPPPLSMAEKCLGKKYMQKNALPENERNPCAEESNVNVLPPVIIPIPQIDNDSNKGSCMQYGADELTLDTNFSTDDLLGPDLGASNDCDLGIPQLKKNTKATISLENFRKAQANDPMQLKLSFMGRLLGRNSKLGDTNQLPCKSSGEKAKSVSMAQKIFEKWIKPKVSCDKCHQKVKLKELLHHKNSIKRANKVNTKRRRAPNRQARMVKLRKSNEQIGLNTEPHNRHANKRSKNLGDNKLSKAVEKKCHERFLEHVNPRRQSIIRRPRHIYTESNSHMINWRDVDVPDLPFSWEGNVDVNNDILF